jgi:hypothetical protein
MALREFTDETGRAWRVWDITAEKLHPSTRAENHMQAVLEGWLAFEAVDGGAKARLYPIPREWREDATDEDLRAMLRRADPTPHSGDFRRYVSPYGHRAIEPAPVERRASAEARSFRYPGGRYWSVAEFVVRPPGTASDRHVLRFTAGARSLDTASWPKDWRSFSDHQLADLLWRSFPRDPGSGNPTGNRRRRGEADVGE